MTQTGISAFEKTLIGVETTAGSTDLPTTYWRGVGKLGDKGEVVFVKQKVGKLGGTLLSKTPVTGAEVKLEGDAIFEQLPYIFNAAFYGVSPTTDSGSSKIRTWSAQAASSDPASSTDLDTLVVQCGDNIQAEMAHYCYVSEYTLSGTSNEAVQISATLPGQAPATTTFAAVTDTDFSNLAEVILSGKGTLYIDPSTDAAGTTQKSTTLIDWSLKHTTGWVPIPAKDGRTDFSDLKHIDDEITLDVTFEHNATAVSEKAAWRAETERVIRLKFTGDVAFASTDTYDANTLMIDMWGKWVNFESEGLDEADGDTISHGTFHCAYSQLAAKKMDVTLVTTLATLP